MRELPVEGEAVLLFLAETLIKHKKWLDTKFEKKGAGNPVRNPRRIMTR